MGKDATLDLARWLVDARKQGADRLEVFSVNLSAPLSRRSGTPLLTVLLKSEITGKILGQIEKAGLGSPYHVSVEAFGPQCKANNEPFALFVFQPPSI